MPRPLGGSIRCKSSGGNKYLEATSLQNFSTVRAGGKPPLTLVSP